MRKKQVDKSIPGMINCNSEGNLVRLKLQSFGKTLDNLYVHFKKHADVYLMVEPLDPKVDDTPEGVVARVFSYHINKDFKNPQGFFNPSYCIAFVLSDGRMLNSEEFERYKAERN